MIRKAVSVALLVILVILLMGIAVALVSRLLIDPQPPRNTVFLIHTLIPAIVMFLVSLGFFAAIWGLTRLLERVLGPTGPASLYIRAGAATLCFVTCFYSRYLGHASYFFRGPYTVVQILALVALIRAYRRIGGVGYLLWVAPVVIELLFWPRVLVQVAFQVYLWYPFWYETAYLYLVLFLAGLYLTRRRYLELDWLGIGPLMKKGTKEVKL